MERLGYRQGSTRIAEKKVKLYVKVELASLNDAPLRSKWNGCGTDWNG